MSNENRPYPAVNPPPIPFDNGITDIPATQSFPDNGPAVFPPPYGPAPTGDYEYLLIPRPPPVPPTAPFYMAFTPFQQVEYEIKLRGASADRIDLSNGNRVYRVPLRFVWRFDHDQQGGFIGRYPMNVYRFVVTDPSIGQALINNWDAIG